MKRITTFLILLTAVLFTSCGPKTKIGSVIFNASSDWYTEGIAGMNAAAQDYKADIEIENCWFDFGSETTIIEEFLSRKVDAVVMCPLDPNETSAAAAVEKGIPLVTWNTDLSMPVTSRVTVDFFMLGKLTGQALTSYIQENDIPVLNAFLITDSFYSVGLECCDGFRDSIRQLVLDRKINVIGEEDAELPQQIRLLLARILEQNPSLSLIWCWNQTSLNETVKYLEEAGRDDIYVCGTDMSLYVAEKMLEPSSKIIAVTDRNPYRMGYAAVENAVKAARGVSFPETSEVALETYLGSDEAKIRAYIEEHSAYYD